MSVRVCWLAFISALIAGPTSAADPKSIVDEVIRPLLDARPYMGVVVGVVTRDGAHVYSYGHVKLAGREQPPDGQTIFALGSLTKAYTGILLADLVQARMVRLDDPAQKYLPPELVLPKSVKPITLLDLTTHYSGLPVQPDCLDFQGNPYASLTVPMLAKDLAAIKLECEPGVQYDYSNYGAGLLGHALARAAGAKSFEEALVHRVCDPLKLADTRVRLSDSQKARLAPGFSENGKPAEHWRFAMLESCGGLFSTADDQIRFLQANLGLTSSPLLAAMIESHKSRRSDDSKLMRVGLGWHILPYPKHPIVWHNGGTGAARCYLGFVPDAKIGIFILTNTAHSVDSPAIQLLRKLSE